jgi:hypothetical protein
LCIRAKLGCRWQRWVNRFGSITRDAPAMSAFTPIASKHCQHSETTLCAICVINAVQQIGTGLRSYLGLWSAAGTLGSRTMNTEPLPGSLATVTSPPIMRASLRESARPSPVPP